MMPRILMPRARAPLATLSNAVQLYDDGPLFWIEFQLMSKRIQPACAALTASRYRERSVELRFWRLPPEENPKRLPAGGAGGGAGVVVVVVDVGVVVVVVGVVVVVVGV